MSALELVVRPDGSVAAIYADALLPVLDALGGEPEIRRASHVEPAEGGGWTADMRPSGGPVLGDAVGAPFRTRAAALAAEVAWLREHVLGVEGEPCAS